ncbi:MAG: hypothetical protein EOO90_11430 [Pedobacter sp.]|nr:MAG: hypothetical protein EOO90_11430 [Pedobacter sp.]
MTRKLKILTVDRKNDDGYWIAGIFQTEEEIAEYVKLHLFEDQAFEVLHANLSPEFKTMENGEYAYQVLVVNSKNFVVEKILPPENFRGLYIDDFEKLPLRIFISAKDAKDLKQKCIKIMLDRANRSKR